MISEPVLQWLLTALFAATGLNALANTVSTRSLVPAVGNGFHVLMSLAMIFMVWPPGTMLPAPPQVAIFSLGALWFLALILRGARTDASGGPGPGNAAHHPGYLVSHIVMMLTMVWMAITMASMPSSSGQEHQHMHMSMPAGVGITWAVITAVLLAFGAVMVVDFLFNLYQRGFRSRRTRNISSDALMNLGMAATCLPMIVG